jgi:thiol-disulfide isomerase/thioredoxin
MWPWKRQSEVMIAKPMQVFADARRMQSLIGKVTVMYFWSPSDVKSLRLLPALNAWQKHYGDDVQIIGIHVPMHSVEKSTEDFEKTVQRFGITFPQVLDWDGSMVARHEIEQVPHVLIADVRGMVRYSTETVGAETIEQRIRSFLATAQKTAPTEMAVYSDFFGDEVVGLRTMFLAGIPNDMLGSPEVVKLGVPTAFSTVPYPAHDRFYLSGFWEVDDHAVTSCSEGAMLTIHGVGAFFYVFVSAYSEKAMMTIMADGFEKPQELAIKMVGLYQVQKTGKALGTVVIRANYAGVSLYSVQFTPV